MKKLHVGKIFFRRGIAVLVAVMVLATVCPDAVFASVSETEAQTQENAGAEAMEEDAGDQEESQEAENLLTAFEFTEELKIMENTNGYSTNDSLSVDPENGEETYSDEYWKYEVLCDDIQANIIYDGWSYDSIQSLREWAGVDVDYTVSDVQTHDNQWTAGKTYEVTVTMLGRSATLQVTIVENLLEFHIDDLELTEGIDGSRIGGYIGTDDNGKEIYSDKYWNYAPLTSDKLKITATFGSEVYDADAYSTDYYDDVWSGFCAWLREASGVGASYEYCDSQKYDAQWEAEKTYSANVSVWGVEQTFAIKTLANPVEVISVKPVMVLENNDGNYDHDYIGRDAETGEELYSDYYYRYDIGSNQRLQITAKYGDESETGSLRAIELWLYDKIGHYPDYCLSDSQSYNSQWEVGNTYEETLTLCNKSLAFDVKVIDDDDVLTKFEISDVTLTSADGNATYDEIWDEESQTSVYTDYYMIYDLENLYEDERMIVSVTFYGNDFSGTWREVQEWINDQSDSYPSLEFNDSQSFESHWEDGKSYGVEATLLGKTAEFNVSIEGNNPVKDIIVQDLTLTEKDGDLVRSIIGYDEETGENVYSDYYYEYNLTRLYSDSRLQTTAIYDDGENKDSFTGTLSDVCAWLKEKTGDEPSYFISSDQSYDNQWTSGFRYQARLTMCGMETSFYIGIEANKLTSLTVEDVTFYECFDGSKIKDTKYNAETGGYEYTDEYWYYSPGNIGNINVSVTYDGKDYSGTLSEVKQWIYEKSGEYENYYFYSDQSYDNQWKVGDRKEARISLGELTATFHVDIKDNPLTEIKVEDATIEENTRGYSKTDSSGGTYWYYNLNYCAYQFKMSATYAGETFTGTIYETTTWLKDLAGRCDFSFSDNQSVDNRWIVGGGPYATTLTICGISVSFNVSIVESQLTGITFEDVSVIENSCGYSIGEGDDAYWNYDIGSIEGNATIKYGGKDYKCAICDIGDKLYELTGNYQSASFSSTPEQSSDNPWKAGNTYKVTAEVAGFSETFDVSIVKAPNISVTVENQSLSEDDGTIGYGSTKYWYYDIWTCLEFSVTCDGKTIRGNAEDISDKLKKQVGMTIPVEVSYDETEDNQWQVNGTYEVKVSVGGHEATANVTITPGNFSDVSIEDTSLNNPGNCFYMGTSYIDPTVTYTYKGVTYTETASQVKKTTGTAVYYEYIYGKMSVGNTYDVIAWLGGRKAAFKVEVKDNGLNVKLSNIVVQKSDINSIVPIFTVAIGCGEPIKSHNGQAYYGYKKIEFFAQSYSTPKAAWKAGRTYTVTGNILNDERSYNVTVEDKKYTKMEISGERELTLKLTSEEGTESWPIDDILYEDGDSGALTCTLVSGNRIFGNVAISSTDKDDCFVMDSGITVTWNGLTSNVLSDNYWVRAQMIRHYMCAIVGARDTFIGSGKAYDFKGTVTQDNIYTIMQLARLIYCGSAFSEDYDATWIPEKEIETAIKKVFGIEVNLEKFTLLDGDGKEYNPSDKDGKVYVCPRAGDDKYMYYLEGATDIKWDGSQWVCTCEPGYFSSYKVTMNARGEITSFEGYEPAKSADHVLEHHEAVAATCCEAGNREYWYCTSCGRYFKDEEGITEYGEDGWIIPKRGHARIHVAAVEPTEESEIGNIEYWYCTECGRYFSDFACTREITKEQTLVVEVPEKLDAVNVYGSVGKIELAWSISKEVNTETYHVYRRAEEEETFALIKTVEGRDNRVYTDTDVVAGVTYYYYVVGVSYSGTEGEMSDIVSAAAEADVEAPTVNILSPDNGTIVSGKVNICAQAEDNAGVSKIRLYISANGKEDWTLLQESGSDEIDFQLDTTEYAVESICIKAEAEDAAGNKDESAVRTYPVDNQGPEKVQGLTYETGANYIQLKWNDVEDADFSYFIVEQRLEDGSYEEIWRTDTTLGANIYGLRAETDYTLRVVAIDVRENRGTPSDEIVCRTLEDNIPPVIGLISPKADYYNEIIPACVTASDNTAIKYILIQTSSNAVEWEDLKEFEFSGEYSTESACIDIDVSEMEEGHLFVRGVARDVNGNESSRSLETPYVEYIIDHSAPKAPEGVTVSYKKGIPTVQWEEAAEEDIRYYEVYRSIDQEYWELLDDEITSLSYKDRWTEAGYDYYYRVLAIDRAGNESEPSKVVSITVMDDEEPPEILSVNPAAGGIIGNGNATFGVLASDNVMLSGIVATYTVNDSSVEHILIDVENIDSYYLQIEEDIPLEGREDGDIIHVSVQVTDVAGMEACRNDIIYTVDTTAPEISDLSAEADGRSIKLTWDGYDEEDLYGYLVYRKAEDEDYSFLANVTGNESGQYSYSDNSATGEIRYTYRVDARDIYGNVSSYETAQVYTPAFYSLSPVLIMDPCMEVRAEYVFDGTASTAELGILSYKFDFGDGTIETSATGEIIHKFAETGNYDVTLTIKDSEGNESSTSKTVSVEEAKFLGAVKVRVVDEDGNEIAKAPVYFNMDVTTDDIKYADGEGCVTFRAEIGSYVIGSYVSNYLPAKKTVNIRANNTTEVTLTLINEPIVTGEFTVTRMTLDEIEDAGIDVEDEANQHICKVKITLKYGEQTIETETLHWPSSNGGGGTAYGPGGDRGNNSKTITVEDGEDEDGGERELTIYTSGDEEDVSVVIIDIPVEARCLKEFFDVRIHLLNNADSEYAITGNTVTLDVPEGMTLMKGSTAERNEGVTVDEETEQKSVVKFDSLQGRTQKTISWVLRGDEAGEYDLSARFEGTLGQFNIPICMDFETGNPIKVYGKEAMKIIVDVSGKLEYGVLYFNLNLENQGGCDMLLPDIGFYDNIVVREYHAETGLWTYFETKPAATKVYVTDVNGIKMKISGCSVNELYLRPGETLTKEYKLSVTANTDLDTLLESTAEIIEGEGFDVEIRVMNDDPYSVNHTSGAVKNIKKDKNLSNAFDYLTTLNNFDYWQLAASNEDDGWQDVGKFVYNTANTLIKWDISGFTGDHIKSSTRSAIIELLESSGFQEGSEDKAVELTKDILKKGILGTVKNVTGIMDGDEFEALNNILSEGRNIEKLYKSYEESGLEGIPNTLQGIIASSSILAGGAIGAVIFEAEFFPDLEASVLKETKAVCKAAGFAADVLDAIDYADGVVGELALIAAEADEATTLLNALSGIDNIYIRQEINFIKESLEKGYNEFSIFLDKFLRGQSVDLTKDLVKKGIKSFFNLSDTAMNMVAVVTLIIEIGFESMDEEYGWGETIEAREDLLVWYTLANKLNERVLLEYSNGSGETFTYLEFLVKCHLAGGHRYYEIMSEDGNSAEILRTYNSDQGTNYQDWDSWYRGYTNTITSMRDKIYDDSTYESWSTFLNSNISIDYEMERVKVNTFYSQPGYLYSYDGEEWVENTSSYLDITPGKWPEKLWIRCPDTTNSAKIDVYVIPARPIIQDSIKAYYVNGKYVIKGITSAGIYCFSDEKKDELYSWEDGATAMEAGDFQVSGEYRQWLCVKYGATEDTFASNVLNVLVESGKSVYVDNDDSAGTIAGAGTYIPGDNVTLTASPKSGYQFAGWYEGDNFLSGERSYTLAIYGDVSLKAKYHKLTHVTAKAATCTEAGNIEYWYCSSCDTFYSDGEGTCKITKDSLGIPQTGHSYAGVTPTWKWSSTKKSAYARFKCSKCGYSQKIKATVSGKLVKAATCTAAGSTKYTAKVQFGGKTYSTTATNSAYPLATGHKYVDHLCSCGAYDLNAPKLLSLSPASTGITFKWKAVSGASKYQVLRKVYGSSKWSKFTTKKTYYKDTSAKAGTKYVYTVRCLNKSGKVISAYNKTGLSAVILSKPVVSGKAYTSYNRVTWKAVSGASGYKIYRKLSTSKKYKELTTVKSTAKYYNDKTAVDGKKYDYYVVAISKIGSSTVKSVASNVVRLTTK